MIAETSPILKRYCSNRLRRGRYAHGATLIAPDTVFFDADTIIGRDVIIEPHVVVGPETNIGEGA